MITLSHLRQLPYTNWSLLPLLWYGLTPSQMRNATSSATKAKRPLSIWLSLSRKTVEPSPTWKQSKPLWPKPTFWSNPRLRRIQQASSNDVPRRDPQNEKPGEVFSIDGKTIILVGHLQNEELTFKMAVRRTLVPRYDIPGSHVSVTGNSTLLMRSKPMQLSYSSNLVQVDMIFETKKQQPTEETCFVNPYRSETPLVTLKKKNQPCASSSTKELEIISALLFYSDLWISSLTWSTQLAKRYWRSWREALVH